MGIAAQINPAVAAGGHHLPLELQDEIAVIFVRGEVHALAVIDDLVAFDTPMLLEIVVVGGLLLLTFLGFISFQTTDRACLGPASRWRSLPLNSGTALNRAAKPLAEKQSKPNSAASMTRGMNRVPWVGSVGGAG